jgi:formylglycine-generating enzyme required for sulfatase activity
MVAIPAGRYQPLYRLPPRSGADTTRARPPDAVAAFEIDVHPVTNAQFLEFVRAHPEWRRSRVKPLFADAAYLRHWKGDLELGEQAPPESPVVHVSWFAARAYCRALGKRLPRVAEWEYVAAASETRRDAARDPEFQQRLRDWYARPTPHPLPRVGAGPPNAYGVEDLHGLVWEWTLDFNSALVTGESRQDAALESGLYCGSGAVNAADFGNYAAFMRYAFRSSLDARYCVASLGFRGARDRDPGPRTGR